MQILLDNLVYGRGYKSPSTKTGKMCNGKWVVDKSYNAWSTMMSRCYGAGSKDRPTYEKVIVQDHWLSYDNFKLWHDENYTEGFHLDKDIITEFNSCYAPENCAYIPQWLNSLFNTHTRVSSNTGLNGVTYRAKRYTYESYISVNGVQKFLGCFDSSLKAHQAWQLAKVGQLGEAIDFYTRIKDPIDSVISGVIRKRDKILKDFQQDLPTGNLTKY